MTHLLSMSVDHFLQACVEHGTDDTYDMEDVAELLGAYHAAWNSCLDAVLASLVDYPHAGGDIRIMQEVDRIVKKAVANTQRGMRL